MANSCAGILQRPASFRKGVKRSHRASIRRALRLVEWIRDAHLVQVGIAGEGEQAGELYFQTETTNSKLARRFEYRGEDELSSHLGRLAVGGLHEGVAVN